MRALNLLTPRTELAACEILRKANLLNTPLLIYCTLRTCDEQAVLYRKSRTRAQIQAKMQSLTDRGLSFLAERLEAVGPQGEPADLGQHVTSAGPGESWHNFGEAFDAVPMVGDTPLWSVKRTMADHDLLWARYGACVASEGLTWGGDWGWDNPHAQLRPVKNPLNHYKDADKIKEILRKAGAL